VYPTIDNGVIEELDALEGRWFSLKSSIVLS